MSLYICPKCGKKVWSEASKCMFCGTSIEDIMHCQNTGSQPVALHTDDTSGPQPDEWKKEAIASIILSLQSRNYVVRQKPSHTPTTAPYRRNTGAGKAVSTFIGLAIFLILMLFGYFVMQIYGTLTHRDFVIGKEEIRITYNNQMYKLPNPETNEEKRKKQYYGWRNDITYLTNTIHKEKYRAISSTEKLGFGNNSHFFLTVMQKVDDPDCTYITLTKKSCYEWTSMVLNFMFYYPENYYTGQLHVMDDEGNMHQFDTQPVPDMNTTLVVDSRRFLNLIEQNKFTFVFTRKQEEERYHCFILYHKK